MKGPLFGAALALAGLLATVLFVLGSGVVRADYEVCLADYCGPPGPDLPPPEPMKLFIVSQLSIVRQDGGREVADVAVRVPVSMEVGKRYEVSLIVAVRLPNAPDRPAPDIASAESPKLDVRAEPIDVHGEVEGLLVGSDFNIEPWLYNRPQSPALRATKIWRWHIEPARVGNAVLTFGLKHVLTDNGQPHTALIGDHAWSVESNVVMPPAQPVMPEAVEPVAPSWPGAFTVGLVGVFVLVLGGVFVGLKRLRA